MTDNRSKDQVNQSADNKRSAFVVAQEVFYLLLITSLSVAATVRVEPEVEQVVGITRESISSWGFLVVFAAMTAFVLFILKSVRGTKLIGAMFAFAVLAGVGSLFSHYLGSGAGILAFVIAAIIYYSNPHVLAFNIVLSFGLAGVSASVGFGFKPMALLVVMACLSVYDVVAVYFTRHMVKIARTMLRRKVFFAMILPERFIDCNVRIGDVSFSRGFAFLGTGDLVLPALFSVSVASTHGLSASLPVILGSVFGLVLTNALFMWQKIRRPMPALPPIVLGCIIGYLIMIVTM
ncbi:MAG: presenilin family intramembrane aspartyl protease [Patescibacteria group bacterium]